MPAKTQRQRSESEAGGGRQSDQAFDVIKREIILCALAPGAHFSEVEIATRMGLARAATRAALTRLEQAGLVQPVPRHGFVVTPITVVSVREAFDLRLMVEPRASALAVGKVDVARLRAINRAPQQAKAARAQLAFVESNRAFHREIAAAAGNGRLFRLLESLADEMERLVHIGLFGPAGNDTERSNADNQHEALIAAFAAGDLKAAERAARLHIEHARTLAMNALLNAPWPVPVS